MRTHVVQSFGGQTCQCQALSIPGGLIMHLRSETARQEGHTGETRGQAVSQHMSGVAPRNITGAFGVNVCWLSSVMFLSAFVCICRMRVTFKLVFSGCVKGKRCVVTMGLELRNVMRHCDQGPLR